MADADNHDSLHSADTLKREDTGAGDTTPGAVPAPEDAAAEPPSITSQPTAEPEGGAPLGRLDRYVLFEKLGEGAFGAVFRARDTVTESDVAVKGLPKLISDNAGELAQIRDSFNLATKLHHPNVAASLHLHKVENADSASQRLLRVSRGDYVVVMEYVHGSTLSAWRHQFPERKVPVDEALRVCADIARGLDYTHSRRVIHRDIKPSNIMVTPEGEAKILDFGLAAELRSSMSRVSKETLAVSGTYPYMAPEQWAGQAPQPATDQYALAVLFYELVSGAVPFASVFETNDARIMSQVVESRTPEPLPILSGRQNRALQRALAKDPKARFASCAEDLLEALGGVVSWGRRLLRVAAVLLLLLIVVAAAVAGYGKYQEIAAARTGARAFRSGRLRVRAGNHLGASRPLTTRTLKPRRCAHRLLRR